ncbi:MAG: TerY-C metal binding domain-containing protein [Bacteroides sp.]
MHVRGAVVYDDYFNGCPHCGAKNFYICNCCGRVVCYHGQEVVTCPNCGASSTLQTVESVDLTGGGI